MKVWFVYLVLAPIALIALCSWLFVFGGYDVLLHGRLHYVEDRRSLWQGIVARELPVGTPIDQVRKWADGRSFKVYRAPKSNTLEILIETIPWHQLVCKEWKVIAEIEIEKEAAAGERVVSMGAGL